MSERFSEAARQIMNERFHRDTLIALATEADGQPYVRAVNAFYEDGAFYVITHAQSGKMRQIAKNPVVAVSGEWFTGHGTGENLGHVLLEENKAIMEILRDAFAAWYSNGHVNEEDPNTCLLKITLKDGVLMTPENRYEIDFT